MLSHTWAKEISDMHNAHCNIQREIAMAKKLFDSVAIKESG